MKKQFLTEVRVGLFVLVGLVLVMVVIFMLGSEGKLFERHYTLFTKFKDISGLRVGAPVQLGGVRIGMVDSIHFSSDLAERDILIELSLNTEYQDRVRADSVATINTQGLLGDKFIFLSVGSEEEPILEDDAYIKSEEITPIFELAEKAGKIMDDIGAITKTIRQALSTPEGKKDGDLRMTLKSLRATMERVETGPGLAHALIYDPKGKSVIENLSRTLKSIGDLTEDVDSDKQTKGLIANLRKASSDLSKILAGIQRGEGTVGKLIKDPEVYNELRTMLGKANRSKLIKSVVRATLEANDRQILK